eukprot:scaffold1220_cov259-Pinguiococcus_pyrenoidosus.AAC.151
MPEATARRYLNVRRDTRHCSSFVPLTSVAVIRCVIAFSSDCLRTTLAPTLRARRSTSCCSLGESPLVPNTRRSRFKFLASIGVESGPALPASSQAFPATLLAWAAWALFSLKTSSLLRRFRRRRPLSGHASKAFIAISAALRFFKALVPSSDGLSRYAAREPLPSQLLSPGRSVSCGGGGASAWAFRVQGAGNASSGLAYCVDGSLSSRDCLPWSRSLSDRRPARGVRTAGAALGGTGRILRNEGTLRRLGGLSGGSRCTSGDPCSSVTRMTGRVADRASARHPSGADAAGFSDEGASPWTGFGAAHTGRRAPHTLHLRKDERFSKVQAGHFQASIFTSCVVSENAKRTNRKGAKSR